MKKNPLDLMINSKQRLILQRLGDGLLVEILSPNLAADVRNWGVVVQVQLSRPDLAAVRRYLTEEHDHDGPLAA